MPNAWLNHVRQFRKQNRNLSYKQLLKQARNTYGGETKPTTGTSSAMNMLSKLGMKGGSVNGMESRSSLTRMATRVGGRSRRKTRRTRR